MGQSTWGHSTPLPPHTTPSHTTPHHHTTMASAAPYFFNGKIQVNDIGEHTFFDVRVRKLSQEFPLQVCIYTSDLPPNPIKTADVVRCSFLLENSVGTQTVRYKVSFFLPFLPSFPPSLLPSFPPFLPPFLPPVLPLLPHMHTL